MSAMRLALAGAAAALLFAMAVHGAGAEPSSDASSTTAPPAPTYVSELGPATSIGPREAGELPSAGSGGNEGGIPARGIGFAMAGAGAALIYIARATRPRASA